MGQGSLLVLGLTEGMFFISFPIFFVHWTTSLSLCVHIVEWGVMVPMMTMMMNDGWEMSCGLATI